MKTFVAASTKVEVNGETIYSVIDGMGAFRSTAEKMLADNGINNPQPGQWYNQQSWLNAFKTISEKIGSLTLYNIGLKIPENAQFPPEINDVHKALAVIDDAYHMNHRGGEIGHYSYQRKGDTEAVLTCNNPYPDDFDKGIITAMCRKFINPAKIKIRVDESKTNRSKGGDSTTFLVSWS